MLRAALVLRAAGRATALPLHPRLAARAPRARHRAAAPAWQLGSAWRRRRGEAAGAAVARRLSNAARGRPLRVSPLPRVALSWRPARAARAQIDENVAREIVNHRMLRHANVVMFKEVRCERSQRYAQRRLTRLLGRYQVILTPTHLGIVMEYAAGACRPRAALHTRASPHVRVGALTALHTRAGGELFDRICAKGRFSEDEARYFFKQLIAGVAYCHAQSVAHRDLKARPPLLMRACPPHVADVASRSWRMRCWTARSRRCSRSATLGEDASLACMARRFHCPAR